MGLFEHIAVGIGYLVAAVYILTVVLYAIARVSRTLGYMRQGAEASGAGFWGNFH
jgi:hypothetical protein